MICSLSDLPALCECDCSAFCQAIISYGIDLHCFPMGMWLVYDLVSMTNRTPIAFQSHTNRTVNVPFRSSLLYDGI